MSKPYSAAQSARRAVVLPLLIVGGVVLAGSVLLVNRPSEAVAKPEAVAAADDGCVPEKAGGAYVVARAHGVMVGEDMDPREGMVILVNPRRFRELGFDGQRRLAASMDCGIAGKGKHLAAMHFRQDRSGGDLYSLSAADLVSLREGGFAR